MPFPYWQKITMKVGVLALQGAFIEHIKMLQSLGVEAVEVRLPEQLTQVDRLALHASFSFCFSISMRRSSASKR